MSDPSTLLLLACAQCSSTTPPPTLPELPVCLSNQEEKLTYPSHPSTNELNSCVSHPETITVAFNTDTSPTDTAPAKSFVPLRLGSTEQETVQRLQSKLQSLGYYNGDADGIYGTLTVAAVKKFQQDRSLSVDGVVGAATWNELQTSTVVDKSLIDSQTQESKEVKLSSQQQDKSQPEASRKFTRLSPQVRELSTSEALILHPLSWVMLGWSVVYLGGWVFILKGFYAETGRLKYVQVTTQQEDPFPAAAQAQARKPNFGRSIKPKSLKSSSVAPQHKGNFPLPAAQASSASIAVEAEVAKENVVVAKSTDVALPNVPLHASQMSKKNQPQPDFWHREEEEVNQEKNVAQAVPNKENQLYTLIAKIASAKEAAENYTYSLINDAGGLFMLKNNQLMITKQALLGTEEEVKYTVTIRRADPEGSYVDKSFQVNIPSNLVAA